MAYVRKFWLITDLAKEYNATLRSVKLALEKAGLMVGDEPTDLAKEKNLVSTRPSKKGSRYTWRYNYIKHILDNADLDPQYEDRAPNLREQYNEMLKGTDVLVEYNKKDHAWVFFKDKVDIARLYNLYGNDQASFTCGDHYQHPCTMEEAIAFLKKEDPAELEKKREDEFAHLFNSKLEGTGLVVKFHQKRKLWVIRQKNVEVASYDAKKFKIEIEGMYQYNCTLKRAVQILKRLAK